MESDLKAPLAARMARLKSESAFEVLARAKDLEAAGRHIIHMEIGDPDFDTPQHIKDAAAQALAAGFTHYVPAPGLPEARQAVARNVGATRGLDIDWRRVLITPGAKPVLFFALLALAEEGSEVIVPSPGFPTYESVASFCGARPVPLPLRAETGFRPDPAELEALISPTTRLLVLNFPSNPCGSVLGRADLEAIADVVRRHPGLYILSDEIYKDLQYGSPFMSIAALPGMLERTIILDGLSKSYAMTGWRLGYCVAPESLLDAMVKLAINSVSCAAAFAQRALIVALEGPQDALRAMKAAFQERRDGLVVGLNSIPGLFCPMPEGAFYAFPSIAGTQLSSAEFERRCLDEAGVAVLAGAGFGTNGEGCVRLSYANSMQNITSAVERIRTWVARLQQAAASRGRP